MANVPIKTQNQPWLHQLHMPVSYAAIYIEIAADRGVSQAQILQQAKLPNHLLANAMGRISPRQYVQFVTAVIQLTGDNGLGFEVGARQPLTAHGSLGYALLCCSTVKEAVDVLQRFWNIRGQGVALQCIVQEEVLVFDFKDEMYLEKTTHRVLFDAMLTSFYYGLRFVLSQQKDIGELWFDYIAPEYLVNFSSRLPAARYNMPALQVRVPITALNQRLPMGNPEALLLAISQCEREYVLLEQAHQDTLQAVRALMVVGEKAYPVAEQLARSLHISTRTLRRRLQIEGSSYHQLLEEARRRDALVLLEKASMEVQKIAQILGYSNPANFTRAFKVCTGKTPSEFRRFRDLI